MNNIIQIDFKFFFLCGRKCINSYDRFLFIYKSSIFTCKLLVYKRYEISIYIFKLLA